MNRFRRLLYELNWRTLMIGWSCDSVESIYHDPGNHQGPAPSGWDKERWRHMIYGEIRILYKSHADGRYVSGRRVQTYSMYHKRWIRR